MAETAGQQIVQSSGIIRHFNPLNPVPPLLVPDGPGRSLWRGVFGAGRFPAAASASASAGGLGAASFRHRQDNGAVRHRGVIESGGLHRQLHRTRPSRAGELKAHLGAAQGPGGAGKHLRRGQGKTGGSSQENIVGQVRPAQGVKGLVRDEGPSRVHRAVGNGRGSEIGRHRRRRGRVLPDRLGLVHLPGEQERLLPRLIFPAAAELPALKRLSGWAAKPQAGRATAACSQLGTTLSATVSVPPFAP